MERIVTFLGKCNKAICALCLSLMVLLIFTNTVLRYLFHNSIIMAEELTRYLFMWSIFLAVISVYYENRHIAVTTIVDRLSPKALHMYNFIMGFGALYGLAILFQGSIMYFGETTTMGQVTGIPYKFAVLPVLVAALCCLCIVVANMLKDLRAFMRGAA